MGIIQLRDEMLQEVVGGDLTAGVSLVVDSQPITGVDAARDRVIGYNEHAATVVFTDGAPPTVLLGGGIFIRP